MVDILGWALGRPGTCRLVYGRMGLVLRRHDRRQGVGFTCRRIVSVWVLAAEDAGGDDLVQAFDVHQFADLDLHLPRAGPEFYLGTEL